MTRIIRFKQDAATEHQKHPTTTRIYQLHLTLTPNAGYGEEPRLMRFLGIKSRFYVGRKRKGDILFRHSLSIGPVPSTRYTSNNVVVRRRSGEQVNLHTRDNENGERDFLLDQNLTGDGDEDDEMIELTVTYRAYPRVVDKDSREGPLRSLEQDGDGLAGAGDFLLLPYKHDGDPEYAVTLRWDLDNCPPETQGVCSLGRSRCSLNVTKLSVLRECMFMVGSVKCFPRSPEHTPRLFWLSKPPFDTTKLGRQIARIVPYMYDFFREDTICGLPENGFHVYIRHVPYKSVAGSGLPGGFVFAWNPIISSDDDAIRYLLLHETVHNWPRIGVQSLDGKPTREEYSDGWFNEGIADYYSVVMPYRMNMFAERQFIHEVDVMLSGYYTNPVRTIPNREVMDKFWTVPHVNRIFYQRGFVYFLKLAHQLHVAGGRSLDDLIILMAHLRKTGQPHHIQVWLSLLVAELGPDAVEEYKSMSNGEIMVLHPSTMSAVMSNGEKCWKLQRWDQKEYYLGFPERCLVTGKVEGLDLESNAAKAGVQEGDHITPAFSIPGVADRYDKNFEMTVEREGELKKLTWWPRSHGKVESYQVVPFPL